MKRRIFLLLSIVFLLAGVMPMSIFADSQSTTVTYSVKAIVTYIEYDGVQTVQKVTVGTTLKEPAHKDKAGSSFLGWQNKDTGLFWNFQDPVTDHLTLVARYAVINNSSGSGSSGNNGSSGGGSSSGNSGSPDSSSSRNNASTTVTADVIPFPSDEAAVPDETVSSNGMIPAPESEPSASSEAGTDRKTTSEIQDYKNGNFTIEIQAENGIADASIGIDKEQWLEHLIESGVITREELSQVTDGASMKVVLVVENIDTTISESSETQINMAADGYVVGQYMDIRIYKTMLVNGTETEREEIHTTGEMVAISVRVPDEMINMDDNVIRQYFIFRNHNGIVDILDAQFDEETQMLTFETNQFSDYAIAYQDSVRKTVQNPATANKTMDQKDEAQPGRNLPENQQKQTGSYGCFIIIIIIILFFLLLFKRRKKDQENK